MPSFFGGLAVSVLVMTASYARATHERNSAPSISAELSTNRSSAAVPDSAVDQELRRTLQALYTGFSFDAGAEPDWTALRALFLPGAAFVDPVKPGAAPHAIGTEEFLADFHRSIAADPALRAGFRERIVMVRMDHFGHVAHAYVTFEGYVPRPGTSALPATTRGVDSVQLVRGDTGTWRVASFTTQYEAPDALLPARFGGRSGA